MVQRCGRDYIYRRAARGTQYQSLETIASDHDSLNAQVSQSHRISECGGLALDNVKDGCHR